MQTIDNSGLAEYLELVRSNVAAESEPDPEEFLELLAGYGKTHDEFDADCQLLEQRQKWADQHSVGLAATQQAEEQHNKVKQLSRQILILDAELGDEKSKEGNLWTKAQLVARSEAHLRNNPPTWLKLQTDEVRQQLINIGREVKNLERKYQAAHRTGNVDPEQIRVQWQEAQNRVQELTTQLTRLCELSQDHVWPLPQEE